MRTMRVYNGCAMSREMELVLLYRRSAAIGAGSNTGYRVEQRVCQCPIVPKSALRLLRRGERQKVGVTVLVHRKTDSKARRTVNCSGIRVSGQV